MKTIEETITKLESNYKFADFQVNYWLKQASEECKLGLKKECKASEDIAQSYMERRTEIAIMYGYIMEIDYIDAIHKLKDMCERNAD